MVTIQVDDETFAELSRQATEQGLTVESWLREFAWGPAISSAQSAPASDEKWREHLVAFISLHRPTGIPMNDRRESIYD